MMQLGMSIGYGSPHTLTDTGAAKKRNPGANGQGDTAICLCRDYCYQGPSGVEWSKVP